MYMEEGLDTGPLLIEEKYSINPEDNLQSLGIKLSKISSDLILKALEIISNINKDPIVKGNLKLIDQLSLGRDISYARQIQKEDYLIDWDQMARKIVKNKRTWVKDEKMS